jgi:hypothetical protein
MPEMIMLEEHGGDWNAYLAALYAQFRRDWLGVRLQFRGKRIAIKRHPIEDDGMEATFWHLITTGEEEQDRTPVIRRCERIGWPRAIADHDGDQSIRWWVETRGRRQRIHLWCVPADYLFVLCEREDYVLPWTAFPIEYKHQRVKLEKRWNQFKT